VITDGIITQELNPPIYRVFLISVRIFLNITENTTSGKDKFLPLDLIINYIGTKKIKFDKAPLPFIVV